MSRVTICIPTYERTRWLAETITSALGQTYSDLVVEVHDDATPDDSVAEVVEAFDDPRLRLVRHAENAGIVGNFSRSLLGASTDYVLQLGDDDVAEPTLVERTVSALDSYPSAGLAHSRFALIDAEGTVLEEQDWLGEPAPPLETGAEFAEKSMAHNRICSSTALIRRSAVPEGAFRQADYPPFDFACWLRMSEHWDFAWVDEVLCRYRIHAQSFSSGLSDLTDEGYLQTEEGLRAAHAVKRRFAATLDPGPRRSHLEKSADRALRQDLVRRVRAQTMPDRRVGPTLQGLTQLARHEPTLLREPAAWKLLAGSVIGPATVERLKGRT